MNDKTNWAYVLIVIGIAISTGGGILFMQDDCQSAEHAASESPIIQRPIPKPVPLPTEIDQNFLNQVNACFIPAAAIYGYTLRITSGFRTVAEQDQLYNQGRKVDGHIVTEASGGRSIHNFGFAVDIVDRWDEYNINWEKLGQIASFCSLEPGDENDLSHFEHRDGLSTDDFIFGKKPASLKLPCVIMDERAKAGQLLTLKDLKNCGAPNF
jgi:hypothetical protein